MEPRSPIGRTSAGRRPTRREVITGTVGALGGAGIATAIDVAASVGPRSGPTATVTDFGASGDGKTDDAAAINRAIESIPESGGTLYFPAGSYLCRDTLILDRRRSFSIRGDGGLSSGAETASNLLLGADLPTLVSARSVAGFTVSDLAVLDLGGHAPNSLFDFSHADDGGDAHLISFHRSLVGGSEPTASTSVSLDKAHSVSFYDCHFPGSQVAIRGRETDASHSNVVRIVNSVFTGQATAHLQNAGQAWTVTGCTFEGLAAAPGAELGPAGAYAPTTYGVGALTFSGCWFGDANPSGDWIAWTGGGLSVVSSYFSGGATGIRLIGAGDTGALIAANQFSAMEVGIDLGPATKGLLVAANDIQASVAKPIVRAAGGPLGSDSLILGDVLTA